MLVYVRGETIVASHADGQDVDPRLYGDDVFVLSFPDGTLFERIGDPPPVGEPDTRLQKIPPPDQQSLTAYASNKCRQLETRGTVNGYGTDFITRTRLCTAYLALQANKQLLIDWKRADGTFAKVNFDQVEAALGQVHDLVQQVFTKEKTAADAIASGSASRYADIDAIFG